MLDASLTHDLSLQSRTDHNFIRRVSAFTVTLSARRRRCLSSAAGEAPAVSAPHGDRPSPVHTATVAAAISPVGVSPATVDPSAIDAACAIIPARGATNARIV